MSSRGHHASVDVDVRRWPATAGELVRLQLELAHAAEQVVAAEPWELSSHPLVGGCFVAFARGEAGPGKPGEQAWAAAVVWRSGRSTGELLAGSVSADRVPAAYEPGLLALREGRLLGAALATLDVLPDVLLVDATGLDRLALARAGGRVTADAPMAVSVRGDGAALDRALGNLVENALVHGPAEGTVTISVRQADGHALVTVGDEGAGLSGDEAERAFERFWRAERPDRPPGSGLGLAIVRATAERHRGSVRVEGSAFTLDLPAAGEKG